MLLPAQRGAAECDAVLLGGRLQRLEFAPGAEIGQRRAVGFSGVAGGIEGEMQDAARRLDRREGPGMHLAQHGRAQGMRGEPRAVLDGDVRVIAPPGRMQRRVLTSMPKN